MFILLLVWQSDAQPDRQIIYPQFYAFLADNPGPETWPRPEFDDRGWQHLPSGWTTVIPLWCNRNCRWPGTACFFPKSPEPHLSSRFNQRRRHLSPHLAIRYANTTFSKPAWTGFRPAFSFTLGEERAKDLFQSIVEKSPQEVIAHLNRAGEARANGRTQQDDVTFVVIKIK